MVLEHNQHEILSQTGKKCPGHSQNSISLWRWNNMYSKGPCCELQDVDTKSTTKLIT